MATSETKDHAVRVGSITIGKGHPLALIGGPCVVEEYSVMLRIAEHAKSVCAKLGIPYIFKASYDKANKTMAGSYRGPGPDDGLKEMAKLKKETGVLMLTDVHTEAQCGPAAEVCDVLQIPALLSKQIDLILAAAGTGRPINIKKGQWTAPWEMGNVINRLAEAGFENVMVTERGTSFSYLSLINDFRGLPVMRTLGRPVIYDGSHSVHGSPTIGERLGHNRNLIPYLCRAAAAIGVDALFLEMHPDPDKALSDAQGTVALADLESLLSSVKPFADAERALPKTKSH